MPTKRQKAAGAAALTTGTAAFGAGAAIAPLERAYNRRVDRGFERRRAMVESVHGVGPDGEIYHNPVPHPKGPYSLLPAHHKAQRAAQGRKQEMLQNIARESKSARRIPLNAQMGRRTGLLIGGGALAYGGARSMVDKRVSQSDVDAGALGAAAGAGGYHAASYLTTPFDRRAQRKIDLDPRLKEIEREHRYKHGVAGAKKGNPKYVPYFRNMPKELPGARLKRVVGYTHGGRTAAAATTAAAVLSGAGAVHGSRQNVGKSLYRKDEHVSILRAGTTAAGLGLAGWGLTRSPMVGRALASGIKQAQTHQNPYALEALRRATVAAGVVHRGTGIAERNLRQVRAVDQAVQRVPASIRADVAAAAGILLVSESHPIRRQRYEPVRVRINMNGRQA